MSTKKLGFSNFCIFDPKQCVQENNLELLELQNLNFSLNIAINWEKTN